MIYANSNESTHSSNIFLSYGKEVLHDLCVDVSDAFWFLSNYKNKTHDFDNTIQLNLGDLTDSQLDTIVKIENFYLKYIQKIPASVDSHTQTLIQNSNEISNLRSIVNYSLIKMFFVRLCIFFGIKISKEELFLHELHSILNNGVCYGASMHLASFSATNNGSLSKNFNQLNHTHIAYIKMLSYLLINMSNLQKCSNSFDPQEHPDFQTQCSELVNELKNKIESFTNIKLSNKKYYELQNGYDTIKTDLLKNDVEQKTYVFSFHPKTSHGHAMVIDLKNLQFFDPNAGVYQFASKERLIEAVFDRVTLVYPQSILQDSVWKLLSVKRE